MSKIKDYFDKQNDLDKLYKEVVKEEVTVEEEDLEDALIESIWSVVKYGLNGVSWTELQRNFNVPKSRLKEIQKEGHKRVNILRELKAQELLDEAK